ncbi:tRNA dihydrouridine(16) synthase DusC [Xylophilus rhododendri]|uniref:tRNA-dihydrouridine(16) synthase n=1 Tax=Xylophilus rhododendri TaxID=2697032 RepID=A0A857JBG3_9BURK|nr:tRNA-dihydrouridine synthase [Xylophilus rhododendri]QHJ00313.1 tRNA dihydrouridine(16) synthase DusC [Xylophilus rhododendri]
MPSPSPILLAPMEGLLDFVLRDVLTRIGGVDRCVSEFIRITGTVLPDRVFLRYVPELLNGSRTPAGTPVRPQLLGSDAACLADNAAALARLQPEGVDLNFGCPANIVNRHGGGAALLDTPEALFDIVRAVRAAVPAHLPVSAKMRLGVRDASLALENARALAEAGACELVVHARTKTDGYRPPAYWELIAAIREAVAIPVVANGEIWTVADAQRCRELSGCQALMLGRGAVADPGLAWAIRAADGQAVSGAVGWTELLPQLDAFWRIISHHFPGRQRVGRLKQWLNLLRRRHPEAEAAFMEIRTLTDPAAVDAWMARQRA